MKTIAIASGKGGVGKSTVTTQLASILAYNGFKVGIIDADIYGPTQYGLLNSSSSNNHTNQELEITSDNKIIPSFSQTHKIYYIAVNTLIPDSEDKPMLWRAPIATRVIRDFIERVAWPELDFLFIDMPPGTGDIQITISQLAKLDGAIIITTPQKVAYSIAAKAIAMFNQVNINIIGIIENMSGYVCTHCHHENHIFTNPNSESQANNNSNSNSNGGNFLAQKYNTELLGAIPLDQNLVTLSDQGKSVINLDNNSPAKHNYLQLIERLLIKLSTNNKLGDPLQYKLINNNLLEIVDLKNNHVKTMQSYDLRLNCPCALCKEEFSGRSIINKNIIPKDISIINIHNVGNYGLRITFSDGHNTGIYNLH
ncbi:MAG: P-loop NTPase [Gammaproteobacteria bacterium]|nr:P-loop NTPase [Gammaproteobacteria bacterium]